jgi:pyruvate dehydrogenase E1 component alpha subunit
MAMTQGGADPVGGNFDLPRFLAHYRTMQRIRAFERAADLAQKEGLVLGAVHLSIGQEAVAAAICGNLDPEDVIFSTHRGHGHAIAKGADPTAMMCELFGRVGGTCGGKGGSMHIADFGVRMMGANGVVAANIPLAVGAAHWVKQRRSGEIVICLFGDGAVNRGPFLEGLNWARIFALPVLFVCEDNRYSATTRTADLTAGEGALARASSLGIPGERVDGNDIIAADGAARGAIAALRAAGGPRFLHLDTFRLHGHTSVDPGAYRDPAEVAAQWGRDPIARLGETLIAQGAGAERLAAIAAAAEAEMAAAMAAGRDAPWPDPAEAYRDVQDVGAPVA